MVKRRSLPNAMLVAIKKLRKGGGGFATPKDGRHGSSVASFASPASSRHGEIFTNWNLRSNYLDVVDWSKFVIESAPFSSGHVESAS